MSYLSQFLGGGSGTPISVTEFSGTNNFTPSVSNARCLVRMTSGGNGGGAGMYTYIGYSDSTTFGSGGAGGLSGQFCEFYKRLSGNHGVTIGAGGSGQVNNAGYGGGNYGGTTYFGPFLVTSVGSTTNSSSHGFLISNGGTGSHGINSAASVYPGNVGSSYCGAKQPGSGGDGSGVGGAGGGGGSSWWGIGGTGANRSNISVAANTNTPGAPGVFGSGGGGGAGGGAGADGFLSWGGQGGAGGTGYVEVWDFGV